MGYQRQIDNQMNFEKRQIEKKTERDRQIERERDREREKKDQGRKVGIANKILFMAGEVLIDSDNRPDM